ncbi:uncharacterized protein LOC142333778 [Lycorma delicatula]|uniref:uncharacterized protein LOC142326641 n=1 Tax=Lycorma delicatula TaxID=130591 RepID=UPI003F51165A
MYLLSTLLRYQKSILNCLKEEGRRFDGNIKWYVAANVELMKRTHLEDGVETTYTNLYLHGKTRTVINLDDNTDVVEESWIESVEKIIETLTKFINNGSGWVMNKIIYIDLNIIRYRPLYGASSSFIKTPKKLVKREAIVNVKNPHDEKCFLWSVLAYLHDQPGRNYRQSWYARFEHEINMNGISYPVKVKDIDRFEVLNHTISINVYGYEEDNDRVYPVRVTENRDRTHCIHLLLLAGETRDKFHYCLINTKPGKNGLSRLLSGLTKHHCSSQYCPYCLHRFSSSDPHVATQNLNQHLIECKRHGAQRIRVPDPAKEKECVMKFRDYSSTLRVPYTVYADFESFVHPMDTATPKPNTSFSDKVAHHLPSGYAYVIVDEEGEICEGPVVYRARTDGENIVEKMLDELLGHADRLHKIMITEKPMVMTPEDTETFQRATECFLCHCELNDDRVRHHSHTTGRFLGACHNECNLNCKRTEHIPVFFHNLRGYDSHHIVQALGKYKDDVKINCIANTSERLQSLSVGSLRFLDSLQFLSSSLEKLVENLVKDCQDKDTVFKRLTNCYPLPEKRDCLIRKGVYPYEYMTHINKFFETQLPPQTAFYSTLRRENITDDDYVHAQNVWESFDCNTLGDYHDLYLLSDVLLLADVFENFRSTSMQYYGLDPCHFYSTPHFTWNAMLKFTRQKLELLTDIDMHLFVEKGTRGGVAMISTRHAKANNPNIPDQYDPSEPTSWVQYYDCNNLYGTAMVEPLPHANFRWLSTEEIDNLDINSVCDRSEKGYILEVDLEYPQELHDRHKDYPLAPERLVPTDDMLSPYLKDIKRCPVKKLLTTLYDKQNYVLHYRNLKLYTRLGLKVKNIHRVLEFSQSPWLKPYIDFNTEKRAQARNSFEKDFFKLMNNAVYGKSLENVRNRIDFQLVTNERKLDKVIAKPRVKAWYIYNKDVVGVSLKKTEIFLNRPIYIGFTVLDISKMIMYEFHYDYMVEKYGHNINLLMTDTDSLMYHIVTDNVYNDILHDIDRFDTSDYPRDHACFSNTNKKRLGKFKDEMNGKAIREFVGLRAKMYSILEFDKKEKNVAKGIPRVSIAKDLRHDLYKKSLFNDSVTYTSAYGIISTLHNIFSINKSKKSLSPYDDKRYILENKINTVPYGHYSINKKKRKLPPNNDDNTPQKRPRTVNEVLIAHDHDYCRPRTVNETLIAHDHDYC